MSEIKLDLKGIKLPEGINYIKVKSQASGYNDGVSTVIPYEIKGTLYAPNVKREGNTLEVEIYFGETQYYAVYVDGVVHTVVPRDEQHTFDLSTFGLPAGTHEITIRARGVNYNESADGTVFTYVAGEETVQISGSWKFKVGFYPVLDVPGFVHNVNFVSNGVSFSSTEVARNGATLHYDDVEVARMGSDSNIWANENYRTITFDGVQNVSKKFYDWLTANAVRKEITFTIASEYGSSNGTTYRALSGMTWGDWIESEYNTKGFTNEQGINLDGMYVNDGYSTVYPDNTIVADRNYVLTKGGAGN